MGGASASRKVAEGAASIVWAANSKLSGDAWICGRTTMQQHFADAEPFVSTTNSPAGTPSIHVARHTESYAISVDTLGKLRWTKNEVDGDHIICVLSERVSTDYLAMLRDNGVSYVVTGIHSVDLVNAMEMLAEHFGIRTLLLEGGGHINGGFLESGLVDEVSLLLLPGIDGRHDIPAVFDGVNPANGATVPLKLNSVERRDHDALWIRYEVVRK
jgi:2,5-diamino-6-(ribosylamino)-4(3H)-pyrimidinone 5'-phosphate reductase